MGKTRKNIKKVPNIRFSEFTDAWEQRKLSEVLEIVTDKNQDRYGKEDVLSVSDEYGCVNQIRFQGRSFAGESISNYKVVRTGDIIYTRSPLKSKPYGIIKVVGKETGIVSPLYIVNRPKDGFDSLFVYRVFDSPEKTNNYLSPLVRKGAKNTMNISNDEWLSGEIIVSPSYEEQKRIGAFFEQLDDLITLYQRKCDQLREFKKGLLQKLFPREEKRLPEIRFSGFTDAWKQRKFSDFVQRESVFRASSSEYPSVEYEDIVAEEGRLNKDIRQKEASKTGIVFDGNQVLYGKLRPYLHNWLNPDFTGVAVGDWWVLRPVGVDKKFLYCLIQTRRFDEVANQSSGSKMPRADWNLVSNTGFIIPSSMDEQRQIAETFDYLDNLIILHRHKCDQLKEYKKGLLQQLFV